MFKKLQLQHFLLCCTTIDNSNCQLHEGAILQHNYSFIFLKLPVCSLVASMRKYINTIKKKIENVNIYLLVFNHFNVVHICPGKANC